MKKILGLDLGTNSIGWALVSIDENGIPQNIDGMNSRIIPMGSDKIDYEKGISITKNAVRRAKKNTRKTNKRYKIRRNKLLYILDKLGLLPEQFQFRNGIPEATKIQTMELLPIKRYTLQADSLNYYELQVNALNSKISLQDFGKVLYKLNQLRGYAGGSNNDDFKQIQDKDDEEEIEKQKYEVKVQKSIIKSVEQSDKTFKSRSLINKGEILHYFNVTIIVEDKEIVGETTLQNLKEKEGQEEEFEIRIKRNKKGSEKITFALPQKTNWRKQMEETEKVLQEKKWYPCQLFLDELKKNKWIRIRNRVILRQQYKMEFDAIWEEQSKYYPFLNKCPQNILEEILTYIFPGQSDTQKRFREEGLKKGLKYIIRDQIIYYQRPLKAQTELIAKCQFEKEEHVTPTSSPIFQEFRCWDQINRLYITSKEYVYCEKKKKEIYQYTNRYLTNEQKNNLYNKLQNQKQLSFNEVARIVKLKDDKTEYLNGLNVRSKLKGCDTVITIRKALGEIANQLIDTDPKLIEKIWYAIFNNVHNGSEYDPDSERIKSIINILPKIISEKEKIDLSLKLAQNLVFPRKYASLSRKAIEEILPIMKLNPQYIPDKIKNNFSNIKHLIETGEFIDESLNQEYIVDFVKNNPDSIEQGGLMYAIAASLVYGRHTQEVIKPEITNYHDIKYNSNRNLRNPIVEQIVNETLQVVKALWKQYKLNPQELEIRVELARDLKNSSVEREKIFKAQNRNKKINDIIKKRLIELNQEVNSRNVEIYKIWSHQSIEDFPNCKSKNEPTKDEIELMRIWEEQKCISPYTLKPIPLSKLFSSDRLYDIDHIIPKSRYFDDSIANKVICESEINEEKDNRTAWEYISQQNSDYGICSVEEYLNFVNNHFYGQKKKNLLAEKISSNPVARQLKDTQYISVAVKNELAKIVGSRNVKTTTGSVTDYLRSQWGLKKLFMELTESRFKQMEIWDSDSNNQTKTQWIKKYFDKEKQKHVYEIKGWSKRYDHRHHSIDALVVALSNDKFVKRLNDLNKYFQEELLKHKNEIEIIGDETIVEAFFNMTKEKRDAIMLTMHSSRKFDAPLQNLVSKVKEQLEMMIVSQKPKEKLIVKTDEQTNKKQLKIRSALHQETYYGKTNGRDTKTIEISKLKANDIPNIIDTVLNKEIDAHRKKYGTMREAFTGEGLIDFNANRFQKKNKLALKPPVYKVKLWYNNKETSENSLQIIDLLNNKKSVITGDNYLFIVMERNKKREFCIASLFNSVELATKAIKEGNYNLKQQIAENFRLINTDKNGNVPERVLFTLQQNDLVYLPIKDDPILSMSKNEFGEWIKEATNKKSFTERIYKVVKFTGKDCFFIPNNYANVISIPKDIDEKTMKELKEKYKDKKIPKQEMNYMEFGSFGTSAKTETNSNFVKSLVQKEYNGEKPIRIQDYCIKLKIDWIGNIELDSYNNH